MKNAKELMLEFTAYSIRDPKKAAEMFADDSVFEMPYLASCGIPPQYKGHDAIAGFFQFAREPYPLVRRDREENIIDELAQSVWLDNSVPFRPSPEASNEGRSPA